MIGAFYLGSAFLIVTPFAICGPVGLVGSAVMAAILSPFFHAAWKTRPKRS